MTRHSDLGTYLEDLRKKSSPTRDEKRKRTPRQKLPYLTQGEAARRAGIAREHWNQLVAGKRGLGEDVAARLARGFGRPLADLQPFVTQRGRTSAMDETLYRLEQRFDSLDMRLAAVETELSRLIASLDPPAQAIADG